VHVRFGGRASESAGSNATRRRCSTLPYLRLQKEFAYLAVILDAYSRRVVGWALDRTLCASLPLKALEQAIINRQPPPGLVHHSDRGVQYASAEYVRVLRDHEMIPSMSRPGNPYDNATCESFLKTLKREEIYAGDYEDLERVLESVAAFIDRYYNCTRLHSALGYRSPAEFENESESGTARANVVGDVLKVCGQAQHLRVAIEAPSSNSSGFSDLFRSTEPDVCQSQSVSTGGSP